MEVQQADANIPNRKVTIYEKPALSKTGDRLGCETREKWQALRSKQIASRGRESLHLPNPRKPRHSSPDATAPCLVAASDSYCSVTTVIEK